MNTNPLRISLVFSPEDENWLRRNRIPIPEYWRGHSVAPQAGDVFRVGGRQFTIQARLWEHDGETPGLRLFVGSAHAESDSVFG